MRILRIGIAATALVWGGVAFSAGAYGGGVDGAAPGAPGDPAHVARTVEIAMGEMYFSTGAIKVEKGETIRFIVANKGAAVHEFNIGTAEIHAARAREMMAMMDSGVLEVERINRHMAGAMAHDDPNSVLLAPRETGEVVWNFSEEADLEFSCNVPGHREAGMIGKFVFVR